jgi:hypothetical protein
MSARLSGLLAGLVAAGCLSTVDTDGLEPIEDYQSWFFVETSGPVPSHGEGIRRIYVNDTARNSPEIRTTRYPPGSAFVKELYFEEEGEIGELDYIAVMRKLADDDRPSGGKLDGCGFQGCWLFTFFDRLGDPEKHYDRCWSSCHIAAPYDGVFLDYRR